jgi:hypothetical protein
MENCGLCGLPTMLYYSGRPICIDCDKKRENAAQERASSQTERTLIFELHKKAMAN